MGNIPQCGPAVQHDDLTFHFNLTYVCAELVLLCLKNDGETGPIATHIVLLPHHTSRPFTLPCIRPFYPAMHQTLLPCHASDPFTSPHIKPFYPTTHQILLPTTHQTFTPPHIGPFYPTTYQALLPTTHRALLPLHRSGPFTPKHIRPNYPTTHQALLPHHTSNPFTPPHHAFMQMQLKFWFNSCIIYLQLFLRKAKAFHSLDYVLNHCSQIKKSEKYSQIGIYISTVEQIVFKLAVGKLEQADMYI